ncbi:MAG: hypothetical protein HDR04_13705 [Lachnospiraceae bacterium]|nr:hypothetical protein [Lachnospiraceae bacterium]
MDGSNLIFFLIGIILSICFIGSLFKLIFSLIDLCDTAKRYLENKIDSDKQ